MQRTRKPHLSSSRRPHFMQLAFLQYRQSTRVDCRWSRKPGCCWLLGAWKPCCFRFPEELANGAPPAPTMSEMSYFTKRTPV
jgi:hypothetical protein